MAELSKTEIKKIKIEENKLDNLENELSNAFEIVQNSFRVQKDVMLTKNSMSGDFDEWKKTQKINREKLKKDLQVSQINSSKIINNAINNTINNLAQVVNNIGDVAINLKKQTKIEAKANKGIRLLSNQTLKEFDKSVAKVYKLRNQEPLFDAIFKQTQEGIDKGIGITYRDGKHFSFKSYMEMNVRTTVRQEANKYLFEASKNNGVVFYICSYFGDCAKDHEDYQGKYYYDEDWTSFGYDEETSKRIQDYIDSNNIESYQSVVDNEPFLTTRPNCRHSLRPVVLDDVFTHTDKQMTNEYDIRKGTYKDSNYIDLQNQRKMERTIRNYKTRLEEHKMMYKENPNPKLKTQIAKDRALIKKWEDEIDYLVNSNSLLKRDKRRESNKVLVQDLGAGYQLGLKIDGKNMYFKSKVEKPISPKDIMPMQKTKVEVEKVIVKNNAFPNAFYENKKKKENIDILIKRINEQKDANPEVVQMFANLIKMESLEKNGIPFAVKFGKNNAVGIIRKFTGEIVDSNIVLQDLTKNNTNGAFHTNLHELGHLIDLYNRDDKNQWFTQNFENVKQILKGNEYKPLSKEIQTFFKETNEKYKQIKNKITKEYDILIDDLDKDQKEGKIDYFEWKKKWEKLLKEKNDKINIEQRNLGVSGFEDIYDALSGGTLRENKTITYGHGNRYYSSINSRIEEIFANYVSLSITKPELVKMLKNDKPELVDLLNNMIKKINEKVK